jgi:hypothetical protein
MAELGALKDDLVETYEAEHVKIVHWNNGVLDIRMTNSPGNDLDKEEQERWARDICRFALKNYTSDAEVKAVKIKFRKAKKVGPGSAAETTWYRFPVSELGLQESPGAQN